MQATEQNLWVEEEEAGDYPAGLYDYAGIATGVEGFAGITAAEVERFRAQGYLVVHNAFAPEEVGTARRGLEDLMAGKNPDFRGLLFEAKARARLAGLAPEDRAELVRKVWRFVEFDARLKALSEHPRLIEAVSRLMGATPELFQDMALIKPPLIGREKPWHQDHAYFNMPLDTTVVGAWIALDDATPENGCMHLLPGSHRRGPVVHWKRRDWQICDTDVDTAGTLAVPLAPGGCLLFHGLLHHGTPANRTPQRRHALQYHYKPVDAGSVSTQERLAVFGSEGKDVTC